MKKILIIIIFITTISYSYAQSCKRKNSGKNENKHIIKTNLLGLFTLLYEHPFADKMSFQVGLQYNPENLPKKDLSVTSIAPEIRYYILRNKIAVSGFYSGIYSKYQYIKNVNINETAEVNAAAVGLNVGYQYIFSNGITTELFAGGGYNIWKKIKSDFPSDNYNYDIRLGIALGYAF